MRLEFGAHSKKFEAPVRNAAVFVHLVRPKQTQNSVSFFDMAFFFRLFLNFEQK